MEGFIIFESIVKVTMPAESRMYPVYDRTSNDYTSDEPIEQREVVRLEVKSYQDGYPYSIVSFSEKFQLKMKEVEAGDHLLLRSRLTFKKCEMRVTLKYGDTFELLPKIEKKSDGTSDLDKANILITRDPTIEVFGEVSRAPRTLSKKYYKSEYGISETEVEIMIGGIEEGYIRIIGHTKKHKQDIQRLEKGDVIRAKIHPLINCAHDNYGNPILDLNCIMTHGDEIISVNKRGKLTTEPEVLGCNTISAKGVEFRGKTKLELEVEKDNMDVKKINENPFEDSPAYENPFDDLSVDESEPAYVYIDDDEDDGIPW